MQSAQSFTLVVLLSILTCPSSMAAEGLTRAGDGASLNFRLPTLNGEVVVIEEDAAVSATVVCFLGAECPLVKLYSPRLSAMASEYSDRGVRFVGVNSNRQDTREDIQLFLSEHHLSFPLVLDDKNVIADRYGAQRTPEVFVLNQRLQIVYHGRIDDQYAPGVNRPSANRQDLRQALEDILAGKPLAVSTTESVGCLIGKVRRTESRPTAIAATVTYCGQVSRVLQKHCVECHRAGEIGPFSLESYEDVTGWADTMQEVVDNGRMPPWHAAPSHGSFANARQMPEQDKQILRDWIAAGLPRGEETELPEPVHYLDGWQTGQTPDLVIEMRDRPYEIPAEGTVEYQYFVVDPHFTEEKWVKAAQVMPGNRSVVHHAIVFIRPPDDQPFRGIGWLTAYVPGQRMVPMPRGHARRVPAGSKLVFQMHYTTNGLKQEDISKVGLVFEDAEKVTDEVITVIGIDQEFEIPPYAGNHEVTGTVRWIPKHGTLLAIAPHMHVRGAAFDFSAEQNGNSEVLLHVPHYDFNWQHSYILSNPLPLDGIDRLTFTAAFDNSEKNPFNPDPSQWVTWGDQTWEEMAVVFAEVAVPLGTSQSSKQVIASNSSQISDAAAERAQKIQAFVDDFFKRLDTNGDGVVMRSEAPIAVRNHFRHYDQNGDQLADREEITQIAERKFPE